MPQNTSQTAHIHDKTVTGSLRIGAATVQQLIEALLQDDGLERAAVLELADSGNDLVVADYTVAPDSEMQVMVSDECRPHLAWERETVANITDRDRHPVFLHSHPFADEVWFSSNDQDLIPLSADWVQTLHQCRFFAGVLTRGQLAVVEAFEGGGATPLPVEIIGDWTLDEDTSLETVYRDPAAEPGADRNDSKTVADDTPVDREKWDRAIRAIGETGQQRLADTHVAVVGCGGIGSRLVQGLAGQGVQQVTFIDPDRVERSNLPRLPQATDNDVGRHKVAVMQQWYVQQVPEAETTVISLPVEETGEYLTDFDIDVIVAGLDRVTPRDWLNEYCTRHLTPYIDAGSLVDIDENGRISELQAQVQVVAPGTDTGCLECANRVSTERMRREQLSETELAAQVDEGYVPGTALTPEPAVNPVNTVAASEAVDQFVRLVTRYQDPDEFVRYDLLRKTVATDTVPQMASCYTCTRFTGTGDTEPNEDMAALERALDAAMEVLTSHHDMETAEDTQEQTSSLYSIPDAVTAFFHNQT